MLLACAACSDALFQSRHWWLGAAPMLFLTLLLEGAVFALITWGMRIESVSPRAYPAALAALLLTLSMFTLGIVVGLALALVVLVPAAAWSLFRNFRFSPALTVARVVILSAGLVIGFWRAWPAHRDADDLLDIARTTARFRMLDSWIIEELRHRPEAVSALEQHISKWPEGSTLELHATLGGSPEFRRPHCEQLLRERSSDRELARICAL
jgi:hypothetical protein